MEWRDDVNVDRNVGAFGDVVVGGWNLSNRFEKYIWAWLYELVGTSNAIFLTSLFEAIHRIFVCSVAELEYVKREFAPVHRRNMLR
jgi:hypothetical protein